MYVVRSSLIKTLVTDITGLNLVTGHGVLATVPLKVSSLVPSKEVL